MINSISKKKNLINELKLKTLNDHKLRKELDLSKLNNFSSQNNKLFDFNLYKFLLAFIILLTLSTLILVSLII